jgi:hypothetical protein
VIVQTTGFLALLIPFQLYTGPSLDATTSTPTFRRSYERRRLHYQITSYVLTSNVPRRTPVNHENLGKNMEKKHKAPCGTFTAASSIAMAISGRTVSYHVRGKIIGIATCSVYHRVLIAFTLSDSSSPKLLFKLYVCYWLTSSDEVDRLPLSFPSYVR